MTGRTRRWGRASWRLSDYEFKCKDHDGFGENWPVSYKDLAPFYDRVEPIFKVAGRNDGFAQIPDSIWYKRSWSTTWKSMFDALVYGLFTGGVFGWLWPKM